MKAPKILKKYEATTYFVIYIAIIVTFLFIMEITKG